MSFSDNLSAIIYKPICDGTIKQSLCQSNLYIIICLIIIFSVIMT
jgi:hypothetical protein